MALAGLDMEPPDFLLGARLLSIARETVLSVRSACGDRREGTGKARRAGDREARVDIVESGARAPRHDT